MKAATQTWETAASQQRWILHAAMLVSLLAALYGPVLQRLVRQWWHDPDYGHGFVVPLFVGFWLWRERGRWSGIRPEPKNSGLLIMLAALGLLLVGSLGAELFTARFSMVVMLVGIVVFLFGWEMLRALAFPLAFLLFMIPIPVILYNQVTFPLQLIASRLAAFSLEAVRVPVLREGNLLYLPNYTLEVVEACSGIRSLMSLMTLAVAYGYWAETRWWARVTLVLLTVPIAVVSNGFRLVGTGVLTYMVGPQVAEGFFHGFSGWVIFIAAVGLMVLCHRVVRLIGRRQQEGASA